VAKKAKKKTRRRSPRQKKMAGLKKLRERSEALRAEITQLERRAHLIDSVVRRVGRDYIAPEGTMRPDIDTALDYFRAN